MAETKSEAMVETMVETTPGDKTCSGMQKVAKICDLIINAAAHCTTNGVFLPRIVVVGSESTGKTSLLNRIVGKDFLPSGTGIVTRMPIQISLLRTPPNDPKRMRLEIGNIDWAEIDSEPRLYTDFNEVSKRIREIMNQRAPTGVIDEPINVRFHSETAVPLSLVDLPGLVLNPTIGQAECLPQQIEDMVTAYIEDPNTIILAIVPANVPESNWKAWQVAKKVDPHGKRTIAALTYVDLINEGTSARDMLSGKLIKVKLGIVGIKNRTQKQLDGDTSLDEVDKMEREFFRKEYPEFADKCGCKYLTKCLNKLLVNKIQKDLPRIMRELHNQIEKNERKLEEMGGSRREVAPKKRRDVLFQIICDFSREYEKIIFSDRAILGDNEEAPCKKIHDIFYNDLEHELGTLDHTKNLRSKDVKTWLENAWGLTPKNFMSSVVFTEICEREIQHYLSPSRNSAKKVYRELVSGIDLCTKDVKAAFNMYPKIKDEFRQIITGLLKEYLKQTEELLENVLEAFPSQINCSNPVFANALDEVIQKIRQGRNRENETPAIALEYQSQEETGSVANESLASTPDDLHEEYTEDIENGARNNLFYRAEQTRNEQAEAALRENIQLIKAIVPKYLSLVRRHVLDFVPLLITSGLIKKIQNKVGPAISSKTNSLNDDELEVLFREDEKRSTKRRQIENDLEHLKDTIDEISKISKINTHISPLV